jgi:hypothetical protein
MTGECDLPRSAVLTSFFRRMETFDAIVRVILSDARIGVDMTFRGVPEQKVLLDFTSVPARVLVNDTTRSGQIRVAVDAEIMHEILLGQLHGAVAAGRRQMLLRGSIADLAHMIPLFDFSPMLYREHLADLGLNGFARRSGSAPAKEMVMQGNTPVVPVPSRNVSRLQKLLFAVLNKGAYALGYLMGTLRHRLFENLSLFDMLSAMSRGMEAATPPEKK